MRFFCGLTLVASFALVAGCGDSGPTPGAPGVPNVPTNTAFTGKVVSGGKAVTLPEGSMLRVQHEDAANETGIELKTDGTFGIGKMPIGKYNARLETPAGGASGKAKTGAKQVYNIPDGFTILQGQTEYTVELGAGYKK
jgi:hypothetical protein